MSFLDIFSEYCEYVDPANDVVGLLGLYAEITLRIFPSLPIYLTYFLPSS